jgi:hypothetical protein
VDQQQRQQGALLGATEVDPTLAVYNLEGTQHAELHGFVLRELAADYGAARRRVQTSVPVPFSESRQALRSALVVSPGRRRP